MAIYRYPYRNPVPGDGSVGEGPTEAVDYIVIKRNRRVYKNNGTFVLDKLCKVSSKLKMLQIKVVLLISYSEKKIV